MAVAVVIVVRVVRVKKAVSLMTAEVVAMVPCRLHQVTMVRARNQASVASILKDIFEEGRSVADPGRVSSRSEGPCLMIHRD